MSDDENNNKDSKKKSRESTGSKTKSSSTATPPTYEERCLAINAISYPLANKKSTKKCYKLVKKAASVKEALK